MAVYAIGDVQGCLDELEILLDRLGYNPSADKLWFVGDLVNRGPRSLDTLRFVRALGEAAIVVLGNHDLHLLAAARSRGRGRAIDPELQPVIDAPDSAGLLDWLQARPLLHRDAAHRIALLHAGLPPQWDVGLAESCAEEVQRRLAGDNAGELYDRMYGNDPDLWHDDLDGWNRLRFTVNAFTRLRVCDAASGRMVLKFKGAPAAAPAGTQPWFRVPWRRSSGERIVFGHWSALGYVNEHGVLGLDTGCVWGGSLTAQRLDVPDARPVQVHNRSGGRALQD